MAIRCSLLASRILARFGFLVFALSLGACGKADAEAASPRTRTPVPVEVGVVVQETAPITIRRTAVLRSVIDVELVAESAGIVLGELVQEGASVIARAPVLALDDTAERAALRAAEGALSALARGGDDLAARTSAEAAVEVATEALRKRRVVAPAAGVVDRFHVDPGSWVAPGTRVARFVDPTRLETTVTVLESEVLEVVRNGSVALVVPALPERRFVGTIRRVGTAAASGTGLFDVDVDVAGDPELRPGFQATVELPLARSKRRLLAPREAVFQRHGGERVFVVEGDGTNTRAVERLVTTAVVPGHPERCDLTSGVEPGARVVIRGRLGLADGDAVLVTSR